MAKTQLTPCSSSKCDKGYEKRNEWHMACSTQCSKDYFKEIQQKRAEYARQKKSTK